MTVTQCQPANKNLCIVVDATNGGGEPFQKLNLNSMENSDKFEWFVKQPKGKFSPIFEFQNCSLASKHAFLEVAEYKYVFPKLFSNKFGFNSERKANKETNLFFLNHSNN